jgi:hypothetical protein
MEDPLNPPVAYTDVGFTVCGASKEELVNYLTKYNQEAAARIDADGETSFDFLDEPKRNRIRKGDVGHNSPHVIGVPITFNEGDRVKTKDGREGTVLGSRWFDELVLYRYESESRMGYFLVKVDFGDHIEYHVRNDLSGDRFRPL